VSEPTITMQLPMPDVRYLQLLLETARTGTREHQKLHSATYSGPEAVAVGEFLQRIDSIEAEVNAAIASALGEEGHRG
jgi:hypothetical protein